MPTNMYLRPDGMDLKELRTLFKLGRLHAGMAEVKAVWLMAQVAGLEALHVSVAEPWGLHGHDCHSPAGRQGILSHRTRMMLESLSSRECLESMSNQD